jgi:hypothetical protein
MWLSISAGQLQIIQMLTNGVNFVHENDTGLVFSSVAKHLPDDACTLTNVLVHYG